MSAEERSPPTPATVPLEKKSAFDESLPTLWASYVVEVFTEILEKVRDKQIAFVLPNELEEYELGKFLQESFDMTQLKSKKDDRILNDGNGLSFDNIYSILKANENELKRYFRKNPDELSFQEILFAQLKERLALYDGGNKVFLSFHRSIQKEVTCVYSIMKDSINKRIIVSMRGSKTRKDWLKNFDVRLHRMEKFPFGEELGVKNVLVRKGYWQYLFDNSEMQPPQRYDNIRQDIQKLLRGEGVGYSICVTGHSLGGSLASIVAFKLASAGPRQNFLNGESVPIPKPVTLITWASVFTGDRAYRKVFERMEQERLIRSLRLVNRDDLVPAIPPVGNILLIPMKHAGISVRMERPARIQHSSRADIWTTLRNTIFKPVWKLPSSHLFPRYLELFEANKEQLQKKTLDELYKDKDVVSEVFVKGISW